MQEEPLITGWPRPMAPFTELGNSVMLPLPWASTQPAHEGDWGDIDERVIALSHEHGHLLCQVCGLLMRDYKIYARVDGKPGRSSGPGMHARCALLAGGSCPHLVETRGEHDFIFDIVREEGSGLHFEEQDKAPAWLYNEQGQPDIRQTELQYEAFEPISIDDIKELAKVEKLTLQQTSKIT